MIKLRAQYFGQFSILNRNVSIIKEAIVILSNCYTVDPKQFNNYCMDSIFYCEPH